ncbi:MAG: YkgJ family cysteine cluster protein [Proteobacteria bacterium]|nr:YkgJ family cysteine cluster protein [Pseudomonadota bacterium]
MESEDLYRAPGRVSFPLDESVQPWLPMLLDAYFITDEGVAEGIKRAEEKGRELACGKGCSTCCKTHQTIPTYPLELVGISWYATEKIRGDLRRTLKERLAIYSELEDCPFLIDGDCSVHIMRPMACRQFNVFGQVCAEGEDAYYTRKSDVMVPIKKYTDDAFFTMLPFYGITKRAERRKTIKAGNIHKTAKVMRSCNWNTLADKMTEYEKKKNMD